MYRVFLVEDDPVIANAVKTRLEAWDCSVAAAEDFRRVMEEFQAFQPELVLLDVSLPCFNGYHWCTEIRKVSKAPVIFLSSASDKLNIVMAMSMGADDFIAKPFDLDVLTAKVQATLRRAYDYAAEAGSTLVCARAALDLADGTLLTDRGRVELTKNELRILQALMERRGEIVSRDTLMLRLWETDSFVDENTLTVNVTRLRRKLEGAGLPGFIGTRKGLGYIVEE